MDWVQLIKDNFLILSCTGGIISFFSSRFNSLKNEIQASSARHEARCDKLYEMFVESSARHEKMFVESSARHEKIFIESYSKHEARCDKLYQMFIDLLKDKKS